MSITKNIRKDFPLFSKDPSLVYLDSTATSLKPQSVINSLDEYYSQYSANVHRGIYNISEKATEEYESARQIVAKFINAPSPSEVIFTGGTTESLNLLAYSLGRHILNKGDEIVTTLMEHHSNFVPWQQLSFEIGADFKIIGVDEVGNLNLQKIRNTKSEAQNPLKGIITRKTKILTLMYVSNVLGVVNPIKKIAKAARKINPNIIIILDAAQASPHMNIDVQDLGCDFIAFSGHKMCGPTGIGVLWGKKELLESMFPFKFGGEMIEAVYIDHSTFASLPHKFEAGTPHIAGAIGLKHAVLYLESIGLKNIHDHEKKLAQYALKSFQKEFGDDISVIGPKDRIGVCSFTFKHHHAHDIAQILNEDNIAVRAGNHCAMPLHTHFGITASVRASFYLYNTKADVDKLIRGLKKVDKILR